MKHTFPDFKNLDRYKGVFVHPQFWPDSLEYENRKIIVIGSGATAVTLVPKLAEKAKHVTMLQRSPTYIVSRPSTDKNAKFLRSISQRNWHIGSQGGKIFLLL